MVSVTIRAMREGDGPAVLEAYAQGIATGHATFEHEVPSWPGFDAKFRQDCRLAAELGGAVVGWVTVSQISSRPVYRGMVDVSLYIAEAARGRGVGGALMAALIAATETAGVWTLQAGIFPENTASLARHERFGFRVLGTKQRVGRMAHGPLAGQWRDVIHLERRSGLVGLDESPASP